MAALEKACEAESQVARVVIGAEFTVLHAEAERQRILAQLATQPPGFVLALGAVTRIDSAAVQVVAALRRSLAARGLSLQIEDASTATRDLFALYGVSSWLDEQGGEAA